MATNPIIMAMRGEEPDPPTNMIGHFLKTQMMMSQQIHLQERMADILQKLEHKTGSTSHAGGTGV